MKSIIATLLMWLVPAVLIAQETNLPERIVQYTSTGFSVTYKFDNPVIRPNALFPGSFLWKYNGFGVCDTPGLPAIPFRTDLIYVPEGYTADIRVVSSSFKDTLLVLSPSIPNLPGDDTPLALDSITPYTGFYPHNVLEYDSLEEYRGVGLQRVTIMPIRYNYNTHKVRVYSRIKYRVTYVQDTSNRNIKTRSRSGIPDEMDAFLSNVTLNYNATSNTNPPSMYSNTPWHSSPYERTYLILTTDEYEEAIQDFVEWKRLKGYTMYPMIHPSSWWTTENAKNLVQAFFEEVNTHHLLIVGGNNDIPGVPFSYTYYNNSGDIKSVNAVSDFEYSMPTTGTAIPQVFRGRIPADNAQQVSTILNKIIQYEKNPVMDSTFYKSGLHCSYFQDEDNNSYEDVAFVLTTENILQHLQTQGKQISRQYVKYSNNTLLHWNKWEYSTGGVLPQALQPDSFAWDGNNIHIRNIINNGVFYVLHRDHGAIEGWGDPSFTTDDIPYLQNENKLPVVFSLNCNTGTYGTTENCFAEEFLKKDSGGCVGIFAATGTSFSGYNDALALGMFDAIWPTLQITYPFTSYSSYSNTPTPTYELGQILDQGLFRMSETYGNKSSRWATVTKKLYHCFGDPSMQIYTDIPQNFAEPLIFLRDDSIFVFVEDGDCKIAFYNKETEEVKSYKGNYATYANPSDSLVICLDRHNYIPYIWDYSKNVYIQNENINGEVRNYVGNVIWIGKDVTTSKPSGDVHMQNSNITIEGQQLELHPGTYIDKNFIFQNR